MIQELAGPSPSRAKERPPPSSAAAVEQLLLRVLSGVLPDAERGAGDPGPAVPDALGGASSAMSAGEVPAAPCAPELERWPELAQLPEEGVSLKLWQVRLERALIDQALVRSGGNRQEAARLLGMKRTTLVEKLKKWAK